ncbi:MAG: GNAT family N-acetyltransferase [Turicibacter sp.]
MKYRKMDVSEKNLIKRINGAQYINRAYREIDGKRQLVQINYQDNSLPNGVEWHINQFERSLQLGGVAFGCFNNENILVGYAVINSELFGTTANYVLLDQLFISLEYRHQGIGKELFRLSEIAAKEMGATKLYICAGSAEETIAFYEALGCCGAQEINRTLYEMDPRDLQLEYKLSS